MYYNSNLIRVLLLVSIIPEYLIALAIFRRRLHGEICWFTIYLLFDATTTILGFFIYQNGDQFNYFVAAWIQAFTLYILAFMVVSETFRNLLAQYKSITRIGVRLLFGTGILLLIIALLSSNLGAEHSYPIVRTLLIIKRSVMFVQVGVVVAMFAFSSYFGIDWKHYQFGISFGFGLLASVRLAVAAYTAQVHPIVAKKGVIIEQVAFLCTELLWAVYFLRPQEPPKAQPRKNIEPDLAKWNEALSELLSR
jgi:uncharacterized membrane protein